MVVQGFEEKDSFGVAQFVSGSPPLVEVQGPVVFLAFQGHAEGVWTFLCSRLVLSWVGFFLVGASFFRIRASMYLAVWVR